LGDIVVIDYFDIDMVVVEVLVFCWLGVVVNVASSTSGCYLNFGFEILFGVGIVLVDGVGCEVMVVV